MVRSRRAREKQRVERLLLGVFGLVLVAAIALVSYLASPGGDGPSMTVYKAPDCLCCGLWMRHLRDAGLRPHLGDEREWATVRSRFKLPVASQGCHTALVSGLLIEGHVPPADVKWLLINHEREGLVGLVVPGMPRGSPGMEAAQTDPYTVYGIDATGNLRPVFRHGE
jgi:hypothetical protein